MTLKTNNKRKLKVVCDIENCEHDFMNTLNRTENKVYLAICVKSFPIVKKVYEWRASKTEN